jgi:hypothetical protein
MADHPTVTASAIPDPALGHWEGDFWVEANGYRVSRYWCDLLPGYYGPCRKDPDNGKGHVDYPNRVNEIIAKLTGVTGVADCDSEIHALETGALIGYLYLTTRDDVPPVPVFWCTGPTADNDSHYFLTGLVGGRGGRKIEQAAKDAAPTLKTYATWLAAGGISVGAVLKLILPAIGINV